MITYSNGEKLDLDKFSNDLIGYQIEHIKTGRIFPMTQRNVVYSESAALNSIINISNVLHNMDMNIDVEEYDLVPIYLGEFKNDWVFINGENNVK